jgi:GT2 family glycosyltransferase
MYSLRREPNVRRSLGDAVLGARRAGRHASWGEEVTIAGAYECETVADWATGAAMLVSTPCLDACGPWDESFFLYSEETEYSLRVRERGYRLQLVPDVSAIHLGGESKTSGRLHALLVVNRVRLYARTHSRPLVVAFWLVAVAREASRIPLGQRASRTALVALLSPRRWRTVVQRAGGPAASASGQTPARALTQ